MIVASTDRHSYNNPSKYKWWKLFWVVIYCQWYNILQKLVYKSNDNIIIAKTLISQMTYTINDGLHSKYKSAIWHGLQVIKVVYKFGNYAIETKHIAEKLITASHIHHQIQSTFNFKFKSSCGTRKSDCSRPSIIIKQHQVPMTSRRKCSVEIHIAISWKIHSSFSKSFGFFLFRWRKSSIAQV